MSIELLRVEGGVGAPDVVYSPLGNSLTCLKGDVFGLTAAAGLLVRLTSGGTPISATGGIWGVGAYDATTDASGNIISPSAPTGVDPGVPAFLGMPSYGQRVPPAPPISGVRRGQMQLYRPSQQHYFIQRHKVGTRVNLSLAGKACNLTFNATTLEWEVDTTATNIPCIVIAAVQEPFYADNKTYYDSGTFATDALGAWTVFQFNQAYYAEVLGLRY